MPSSHQMQTVRFVQTNYMESQCKDTNRHKLAASHANCMNWCDYRRRASNGSSAKVEKSQLDQEICAKSSLTPTVKNVQMSVKTSRGVYHTAHVKLMNYSPPTNKERGTRSFGLSVNTELIF